MTDRLPPTTSFDPVAASLEDRVRAYLGRNGGPSGEAAERTVAISSRLVEERASAVDGALAELAGIGAAEGTRLLDLGCGFGSLGLLFAFRGASVLGVDPGRRRMAVGADVAVEHGLDMTFRRGAMGDRLPAEDAAFDVVLVNTALCYVVDTAARARALAEMRRVVRRDGWVLIVEPNRMHPLDPFTRLPAMQWLPPAGAQRVASTLGRRRPLIRLTTARGLGHDLRAVGFVTSSEFRLRGRFRGVPRRGARYFGLAASPSSSSNQRESSTAR